MAYRFSKQNRLCEQKLITQLYQEGQHFVVWPLRVTWKHTETATQVLVWAPKSLFKHAVQRNRLRRLMREAYRLNQGKLSSHCFIAFNYIDKKGQSFAIIEKAVCKALKKISGK